ncbi:MAG: B12-binding domain-containing radical SAM protein [Myxococcota bacterium]
MSGGTMGNTQPRAVLVRIAPILDVRHPHPRDVMWPVQLLLGAAQLRSAGWKTTVVDTWTAPCTLKQLEQRLIELRPDWLFLETRTPTARQTLELAGRLKAHHPGLNIFGTGQHPSEKPEDFLFDASPFEACLAGELEGLLPSVLRGERGVPGYLSWCGQRRQVVGEGRAQVQALDGLPLTVPEGLDLPGYRMLSLFVPGFQRPRWGYTLSSRGCAYACTFCSPTLRQSYGTAFRGQSPERIVEELAFLHQDWGCDAFYFIDDLFTGDLERVHGLCEGLLRRGLRLRWTVQTRLDHLDRALVAHMKAAGCVGVKVGVESGSPRIASLIKKALEPSRALEMGRMLKQQGIPLTACFLVGNPTETLEELEQTFRFACQLDPFMLQVAFHTPYPGSESFERYASGMDTRGRSHFDGVPLNLSAVPDEVLIRFHRNFYLRYYLSPRPLLRYVLRRAPYTLVQGGELELLSRSLTYLTGQLVRGAGAGA